MSLALERTYRFSAAHRYHRPDWTEEENLRRFGRCSFDPGHGHNYRLTLEVAGDLEEATGFVVDLVELDRVVRVAWLDRVDHRHLNHAIEAFGPGGAIPTCENLVLWIRDELLRALPTTVRLVSLRLAEDDDLAATWRSPAI